MGERGGDRVRVDVIDFTRINIFYIVDKTVLGEKVSNHVYTARENLYVAWM